MTESKHLKRRVRERMARTGERYAVTSEEAVLAGTGRELRDWFALLDEHDATGWGHTEIARWLREEHGVAGWWAQSVTGSYERARGLREA